MDLAPLITAQNTARHAVTQENHEQAAAEYSAAADGIQDTEAMRILALLESHHHQLARIIKTQSTVSTTVEPVAGNQDVAQKSEHTSTPPPNPLEPPSTEPVPKSRASHAPILQRRPMRDVSSTIASDLATARGIPGHQPRQSRQLSPASALRRADGQLPTSKQQSPDASSTPKRHSQATSNQTRVTPPSYEYPPLPTTNQSHSPDQHQVSASSDAFNKFYSTFEGLLSKLSAPLAFAGLPLTPGEEQQQQRPRRPTHQHAQGRSPQPMQRETPGRGAPDSLDFTHHFSKAALRAVKDDNPGFGGMQESYMVVPTAGGTVSYAGILAKNDADSHDHSHPGQSDHPDNHSDHFVDAAEAPVSPTVRAKGQRPESQSSTTSTARKSTEELEAENQSLKQLIDNLSRRLYMWEKSSQTQSRALQQSIKTLQMPSQILPDAPPANTAEDARLKDLEQQLAAANKEMQRYERENEKLKTVVTRYRERWEKLKEGARVRREGAEKGVADHLPAAVDAP